MNCPKSKKMKENEMKIPLLEQFLNLMEQLEKQNQSQY